MNILTLLIFLKIQVYYSTEVWLFSFWQSRISTEDKYVRKVAIHLIWGRIQLVNHQFI